MYITATDAGVIYGYEDIFGGGGFKDGFGFLLEGHFVRCVEDEGEALYDPLATEYFLKSCI